MATTKKRVPAKKPVRTLSMEDAISVLNPVDELPAFVRQMTAGRLYDIITVAENGDTRDLFALYRDIIASDNQVQTEFVKRKAAVSGDTVNMIPWDKLIPADVAAKEFCWKLVDTAAFESAKEWMLNAVLFPVAVCEKVYRPTAFGYALADVVPVHYQLLDYRTGRLKIFDTDQDGRPQSTSHDPDPNRYIIHRGHSLPMPDQWGGPMRALLFWWLLRTMSRQWWADLLERFGVPFLKGKYSDEAGRAVLERAFRLAVKLGAIVISKGTEAEIVQAASSDKSDSHERFIELCNREISKLITGQTLSTQASPTGELGSGTANLQGEVREDLRKMDARRLAMSMRSQLLAPYLAVNGLPGNAPVLIFGADSSGELNAMMSVIKSLGEAGFEPDDDGMNNIAERVGFGIRRKTVAAAAMPFSALPLNVSIADSVAPSSAADLALAFRGRFAPVAAIIAASESPQDCIGKVRSWALSSGVSDVTGLLENALTAYCAAGAKSATR